MKTKPSVSAHGDVTSSTDVVVLSPEPKVSEFIAFARVALDGAKKANNYLDADAVIARLEHKLAAAKVR